MIGYLRYPPHRQIMAPDSFWNARIPANVARHPDSAAIMTQIRQDCARNFYPNTINAGIEPYVVPADHPTEPVALWRSSWGTAIPSYNKHMQALLFAGVPIPDDFEYDPSSDSSLCIYQLRDPVGPDGVVYHGVEWDIWRFKPRDPNLPLPGFSDGTILPAPTQPVRYTCEQFGRLIGVEESVGRFRKRYTATARDTVTNLPKKQAERDCYEDEQMGCSASGTPLLPGVLTSEDVARGDADHALRLELAWINNSYHVWPANRHDGSRTYGPVVEGLRIALDPSIDLDALGLDPVPLAAARSLQKCGWVVVDKATNAAIQCDRKVLEMFNGVPPYAVLEPLVDLLEHAFVVAVGSDAAPNPTI